MTKEEKIDKAALEYRREHLKGADQLTTSDWTAIYKKAGMSEKEIAAHREEMQKYAAALDDPLDQYRS